MKYSSRLSMTSGTPASIQNWVLSGFQNSFDLASMSLLEAKAISSALNEALLQTVRRSWIYWFNRNHTETNRYLSIGHLPLAKCATKSWRLGPRRYVSHRLPASLGC